MEPFPGGLTAPQLWLDGILPKVPTAGADLIKHEVLTVARDFYSVSGAWRAWVGPIRLNEDQTKYAIETADIKAECTGVVDAIVIDTGMRLHSTDMQYAGLPSLIIYGDYPTDYYCPNPQEIVFMPRHASTGPTCSVSLLIKMRPIDLDWPQHLASEHFEAISHGVLASLYDTPGLMYKPDQAREQRKRYIWHRSRAKRRAEANYTMRQRGVNAVGAAQGTWRGRRG